MVFVATWLVDDRVILLRESGILDGAQLLDLIQTLFVYIEQGTPPIHLINDRRTETQLQIGLADLQKLIIYRQPLQVRRMGWSVAVHPDASQRFFTRMANQIIGLRNQQFATLPQACAFLVAQDDTLPSAQSLLKRIDSVVNSE